MNEAEYYAKSELVRRIAALDVRLARLAGELEAAEMERKRLERRLRQLEREGKAEEERNSS